MSAKKTAFMKWIDGQLKGNTGFARRVGSLVNEMKIERGLEDRDDVSISVSRLANPREKRIPYAEFRKRALV